MPEGDTIFRTARALGRALVGKPITGFRSTYPMLTRFDDDTPLALIEAEEGLKPGDRLIFCSVGAGATMAAIAVEW